MKPSRIYWTLATATMAFLFASTADAVVVTDWSGNYVTASQTYSPSVSDASYLRESSTTIDFNTDSDLDDAYTFRALSLTTPFSPPISASYSGTSATFYGGYTAIDDGDDSEGGGSTTVSTMRIFESGSTDEIELISRNSLSTFVYAWLREDFLTVGSGDTITASLGDSLSANVSRDVNMSGQFLVRDGSTFYLSQSLINGAGVTSIDPSTEMWAVYSISAGQQNLIPGTLSYTTVGSTLTDINVVGFIANTPNDNSSGNALDFFGFEADLTATTPVVPEPSTLSLLGLGILGLVRRARRRRV